MWDLVNLTSKCWQREGIGVGRLIHWYIQGEFTSQDIDIDILSSLSLCVSHLAVLSSASHALSFPSITANHGLTLAQLWGWGSKLVDLGGWRRNNTPNEANPRQTPRERHPRPASIPYPSQQIQYLFTSQMTGCVLNFPYHVDPDLLGFLVIVFLKLGSTINTLPSSPAEHRSSQLYGILSPMCLGRC